MFHWEVAVPKSDLWFEILLSARKLSPDKTRAFTSAQLAQGADIQPGPKSTREQIASAWMSKLVKWGYALHAGKVEGAGVRMTNTYVVTDKGHEAEAREGRGAQLGRLVEAVRAFQATRGSRNEANAYKNLIDMCDAIQVS
jgi:hypothetical protein